MIDPRSDRPLFRQVADILRAQITSGRLAPGDRLPSEATLSQEYGLARASVRAVIALLRSEGLVTTERGYGTKVREQPARETVVLHTGDEVIARPATEDESRRLDIDDGVPVIVVNDKVYPADTVSLTVE